MLVSIEIPPGISRNGTRYQTRGRWYDCNLIRWVDGITRPVGGWTRFTTTPFDRKPRGLFSWGTNGGARWLAVGTSTQLLVTLTSGVFYDITPSGFTAGSDDAVEQLGYGGGNYGSGTYGTPRSGGSFVQPMTWQLDSWGEYLVGCARNDGRLYEWQLGTGSDAAVITNAPTNCTGLIVSDQRHLIALGAGGNPRKVQWSGKEANTVWTPASTNEAGSFEVQSSGNIVRAVRVRGQILICTNIDAHVMNYIGQPFIFSRERVGLDCGLLGPNAIGVAASFAVWMGDKRFWIFDGGAVRSLDCEVADYVFTDINIVQGAKVSCGHNGQYGEVWWFYPSAGQNEPNRYVIWNYRENHWAIGQMPRVSWIDRGVFSQPIAGGADSHLYRHEEGWLDNGATRVGTVYAEAGALEVGDGENIMQVMQVIPDEQTRGEVTVSFRSRFTPGGAEYSYGPYAVRTDGYTDTRVSGRQIVMRVDAVVDDDFRVGKFRFDAMTSGRR